MGKPLPWVWPNFLWVPVTFKIFCPLIAVSWRSYVHLNECGEALVPWHSPSPGVGCILTQFKLRLRLVAVVKKNLGGCSSHNICVEQGSSSNVILLPCWRVPPWGQSDKNPLQSNKGKILKRKMIASGSDKDKDKDKYDRKDKNKYIEWTWKWGRPKATLPGLTVHPSLPRPQI